ncbi:MAG: hypothetical protein LBL13_08870 [Bacteroidales bacterium]|jgi:hypothetical protein|nr:hypothetical protein [Bacteroidales bacterium]
MVYLLGLALMVILGIIVFLIFKNVVEDMHLFYRKMIYLHHGVFLMWLVSMTVYAVISKYCDAMLDTKLPFFGLDVHSFFSVTFMLPVMLTATILLCLKVHIRRKNKSENGMSNLS